MRFAGRSGRSFSPRRSLALIATITVEMLIARAPTLIVMGSTHEEVSGVEVEVSPRKLGRFLKAEIERIIGLSEPFDPAV